jgi:hypothetical protein
MRMNAGAFRRDLVNGIHSAGSAEGAALCLGVEVTPAALSSISAADGVSWIPEEIAYLWIDSQK